MRRTFSRRPPGSPQSLAETDLPPLLRRLYAARGVKDPRELESGLHALHPDAEMLQMASAVAVIGRAVEAGDTILVVGDFDCDGAASSAIALSALQEMGAAQVDFLVPNRFDFGYGLSPEIVEVAARRQPDLLITVDNGVSSVEGVAAARRAGMRVVVTDHHLPGKVLPQADALVNPNQPGCNFPAKHTCGAGVIFYVLIGVRRWLEARGWFRQRGLTPPKLARHLDLVALATVADVVPLDRNNRILVEQGLRRIRAGRARPGLRALLDVAGRDASQLVATDLGFAIAPRLNAAGRLDDMALGIRCLLASDEAEARELAVALDSFNRDRRLIEQGMQEEAARHLAALDTSSRGLPTALSLYDAGWHEGVVGILASRVKERYHRPVVAFAPAENGDLKGSGRSIPGFHLRDALAAVDARHPGLLKKFGGHAMAAGLSLAPADLDAFSRAFAEEAERRLEAGQLEPRVVTDGALDTAELTLETAQLLRFAGPWGQHFPEPLFDGEFRLLQQRIVGERHLKLRVATDSGQILDAIAFNADLERWPDTSAQRARLAYKLDVNDFRGRRSLQLLVEYLEPA